VGSHEVPFKGVSFINVLCVLKKTLQIEINFKFVISEIDRQICTGYYAEIGGEIFQHKSLGTWKMQDISAIETLETFVNKLIIEGQVKLSEAKTSTRFLSKKTQCKELVEKA
jgi:hypothetical protein